MPGFQISPFAPFCFCVWVAFLQVEILIALWRCSSARGCGAEYQPFQVVQRVFNISLSPSFSVCISCSVPIVLSGYTKIAGMERRGRFHTLSLLCHHGEWLAPAAVPRTSTSLRSGSVMPCPFSFSQKIISTQFFCFMVILQKEVFLHRTNPLRKKICPSYILLVHEQLGG